MRYCGVILAAGLGSRMGRLCSQIPKPLLQVGERPLIAIALDKMIQAGVSKIFVNLHYKWDKIQEYVNQRNDEFPIVTRFQSKLNGPAGALAVFRKELGSFDRMIVTSSDVLMSHGFRGLMETSVARSDDLTFACTSRNMAKRYGVLEIAENGDLISCREKPDVPDHEFKMISAGAYCAKPSILPFIPQNQTFDYAKDLAPRLLSANLRVGTYRVKGYWRDVGTPDCLEQAREDYRRGAYADQHD